MCLLGEVSFGSQRAGICVCVSVIGQHVTPQTCRNMAKDSHIPRSCGEMLVCASWDRVCVRKNAGTAVGSNEL